PKAGAEVDGAKILAPGGDAQLCEILTGGSKQPGRGLARNPALKRKAGRLFGWYDEAVVFAAGAFHDVPAIACAVGVVDDQRRDGAAAGRFFELVGPAAIVGHRAAAEFAEAVFALRRDEIGIVDQKDRDLALEVDALEVVPAAFG